MAETTLQRGLDWLSDWGDFISDAGAALPFDLSDDARVEPVQPGLYDVGQIVKDYQHKWLGVSPNHATPLELHELLLTLGGITGQLEASIEDHAETSTERLAKLGLMGAGLWMALDTANRDEQRSLAAVKADLDRWRQRLDAYTAHVEAAIPDREQDRRAVLWEVTAPLFLGWYGGPTGVELPIVGQPEGFNPTQQHTIDLGTPFEIANELGVWIEWSKERRRRLAKDLEDEAKDQAKGLGKLVAVGAIGLGLGAAAVHIVKGQRA